MGEQITNAEWEKISPDNFETASLGSVPAEGEMTP